MKTNSQLSFELLNNEELSKSLKEAFLPNAKFYFAFIGFGIGSVISILTRALEDISVGDPLSWVILDITSLHHLITPILLGIIGAIAGIIYDHHTAKNKKVYAAFYESQQALKLITDNLPSLISYIDSDLRYLFANKMFSKWFKINTSKIYGKKVRDVLKDEAFNEIHPYLKKALEGQMITFNRTVNLNHNLRFLETTFVPHFDDSSSVIGIFSLTTNITQLKKRENRIKKQKNELEKLNITKDKLFSIIAHDLKSPFSSILGFSQILHNELESLTKEEILEITELLNIQSKDSYNLLSNILDWARTQLKGINPSPEEINLANLAQEIIENNKLKATLKKVTLEKEILDNIKVFADRNLIHSVLQNLITNSIKFTPENGKVKVKATNTEGEIQISVIDTGIGMTPDQLESLFLLNTENQSTPGTNNEEGTGLGLIICKEFIERNGGKLTVSSEKGAGSTFSFNLPIAPN